MSERGESKMGVIEWLTTGNRRAPWRSGDTAFVWPHSNDKPKAVIIRPAEHNPGWWQAGDEGFTREEFLHRTANECWAAGDWRVKLDNHPASPARAKRTAFAIAAGFLLVCSLASLAVSTMAALTYGHEQAAWRYEFAGIVLAVASSFCGIFGSASE